MACGASGGLGEGGAGLGNVYCPWSRPLLLLVNHPCLPPSPFETQVVVIDDDGEEEDDRYEVMKFHGSKLYI